MHVRGCCAVAAVGLLLAGCGGHGPRVTSGNIEVFYVEGASKEEAQRLADYLGKTWVPSPDRRSVQLKKSGDGYQFRMVVKKEFHGDAAARLGLEIEGARMSRDVFGGAALETHVCDEHFKTIEVVPPRPDIRYGILEGMADVFFPADFDRADAERFARFTSKLVAAAPAPITFKLARRGAVYEVHMACRPEVARDAAVHAGLRAEAKLMSTNAFNNAPVEMHLCDERLQVLEVLK